MKATNYIYILLFAISLANISSCSQKQTTINSFKAKVNGNPYDAVHVSGFITPGLNTLLLTGAMGTGEDIQLFLPKNIASGTYDFTTIQGKYQQNDELAGFAVRGSLTIITHNIESQDIKGSFYFTTKPLFKEGASFDVTEGAFDITY